MTKPQSKKEPTKVKEQPKVMEQPKVTAQPKVTKDTNVAELIFRYPDVAEILTDFGLHCVGCFANSFDTIEMGAKIHGMSVEEIQEMVDRVNEVIETSE